MRRGAMLALFLLTCTALYGAELAGVTMPDEVQVGDTTLVLNGLGLREATFLKVDVYVAGLFLEERSSDAQAILDSESVKRIDMRFVRKVKRGDMVEAWDEGFEKNAGDGVAKLRERIDQLNAWMPDVKKGDTMTFTYVPGQGVEVEIGGESRGTIEGTEFARVFFSIWLGPEPPNEGLKTGMLG